MNIIEKLEALIAQVYEFDPYPAECDKVVSIYALQAIIEEYKNAQEPVFDLAKGLNYIADNGYWPQVIYDDNGYWAIQDEGGSNIRGDNDLYTLTIVVPPESFKPTLKEAWSEYMRKLVELGNEIDVNCAFTHPPLSDGTVKAPEGYALVPIVPTKEMQIAAIENYNECPDCISWTGVYQAMIDEAMKAES